MLKKMSHFYYSTLNEPENVKMKFFATKNKLWNKTTFLLKL